MPTHNQHMLLSPVPCLASRRISSQSPTGGCDDECVPLCNVIRHVFTPTVLGCEVLVQEHELFSLSVRYGGLALTDPVSTATNAFRISKASTTVLQKPVKSGNPVNIADHDAAVGW